MAIVITTVAALHLLAMTVVPKKNCARIVQFWKDLKKWYMIYKHISQFGHLRRITQTS